MASRRKTLLRLGLVAGLAVVLSGCYHYYPGYSYAPRTYYAAPYAYGHAYKPRYYGYGHYKFGHGHFRHGHFRHGHRRHGHFGHHRFKHGY